MWFFEKKVARNGASTFLCEYLLLFPKKFLIKLHAYIFDKI